MSVTASIIVYKPEPIGTVDNEPIMASTLRSEETIFHNRKEQKQTAIRNVVDKIVA